MRGVVIAGYSETPVDRTRKDAKTIEEYLAWTMNLCLEKIGLEKEDLNGQGIGLLEPETIAPIWSMNVLQGFGISPRVLLRSDHGGTGGAALLEQAAAMIQMGKVDIVLCLGADAPLGYISHGAPMGGGGNLHDFIKPYGIMGPNSLIGFVAQRYIHQYGVKPDQVGEVAVVHRYHASLNPLAYLRDRPIKLEDYLDDAKNPLISDPVRLLDCCIPVNGGLSFVVASEEKAKELTDKPVYVLGLGQAMNHFHGDRNRPDITYLGVEKASKEALNDANVRPKDMSFLQCYDDYTYAVLMHLEDCGFCEKGKAGSFVKENGISLDGGLPVNTGGGQLSSGQAGMIGAYLPLVEGIRQIKGDGGRRQVKDAKLGLVSLIGAIGQYCSNLTNTATVVLSSEKR